MTVEEIQDATEELWRRRSEGERVCEDGCGWCRWAVERSFCSTCPLAATFDIKGSWYACNGYGPFKRWAEARIGTEEGREAAKALYRLLVDNREEILAKAREVQSEAD
jgi:hypothetical protein